MSVYFRCTVQNEAIDFINIWQTSSSLNEVFERLEDSETWNDRVDRLGNRTHSEYDYKNQRWRTYKARKKIDMSTRTAARRFYLFLKHNKGIPLQTWGDMPYYCQGDIIDLRAYATMVKNGSESLRAVC